MKLKRLLEYLYGTYDLPLILGADDIQTMYTFVNASYAVHHNMKSHTGGVITFGRGGIACKSTKQKLVTKSSTEAELVGSISYRPKVFLITPAILNRTIKAPYASNGTDMHQPVNGHNISIFDIFLLIILTWTTSPFGIAKPTICLLISCLNRYKGVCFISSAMYFWVLPICPHSAFPRAPG